MNVQFTDKIECIFKHTLLLIQENGFHGTPMSQIAKSADVAIGTIYHYFPSKENLLVELFIYCKKQVNKFIFCEWDKGLSYKEQFSIVFKRFCTFYLDHQDIFSFMEQFHNSPFYEIAQGITKEGPCEENRVLDFLLHGMEIKALKQMDMNLLTSVFIGVAVSFSKSVIYKRVEFEEKKMDDLVEIIWNGVKENNEYEI